MKRVVVALLFVLASVLSSPAQAPDKLKGPGPLPALPLHDQFERPFTPATHQGHVCVLLYGDRASTDANKVLGEYLHVTFHPSAKGLPPAQAHAQPARPLSDAPPGAACPDVRVLAVACCGKVPSAFQGLIRGQIKAGAPEVPVLLDFNDVMKNAFGLVERVPNLVIVDRAGTVRYTANGPLSPEQMTQMTTAIENLRREPLPR